MPSVIVQRSASIEYERSVYGSMVHLEKVKNGGLALEILFKIVKKQNPVVSDFMKSFLEKHEIRVVKVDGYVFLEKDFIIKRYLLKDSQDGCVKIKSIDKALISIDEYNNKNRL